MLNEWLNTIGTIYWFFMLVVYPLTVRDGYYDIDISKLVFFYVLSFLFILANIAIIIASRVKKEALEVVKISKIERNMLIAIAASVIITFLLQYIYG